MPLSIVNVAAALESAQPTSIPDAKQPSDSVLRELHRLGQKQKRCMRWETGGRCGSCRYQPLHDVKG